MISVHLIQVKMISLLQWVFFLLFLGTRHLEIKGKYTFIIENLYYRIEKKNKGS